MGSGCLRRPSVKHFLNNTAFGLFVGFELAIILAWTFDSEIAVAPQLLTASAALIGALLAIAGVLASIQNQDRIANDQRERSLAAANATLPLTLAVFSKIAERGAQVAVTRGNIPPTDIRLEAELELPLELIASIKEAIEYATLEDREHLAKIIRDYQISWARLTSWLRTDPHILEINYRHAVDWAVLTRKVENCFGYARAERPNIPPVINDLNLRSFFSVRLRIQAGDLENLMPEIQRAEDSYRKNCLK